MRNSRTATAWLGAIIVFLIIFCSLGTATALAAAQASGSAPASGALETIPTLTVSGGLDKIFSFNCEGHAYTWDVQVPSSLVSWDRSVEDTLNAFYANGGSAQAAILGKAPADVIQLIKATYPNAGADDRPWVNEPRNDAYVRQIAAALLAQGEADSFDRFQQAELALSFVQSIPYVPDQFPRLAALTLVDNGDCDDRSVLLAGLLKDMSIGCALLYYTPQSMGLSFGHMNVGIAVGVPAGYAYDSYAEDDGSASYIAETTNRTPIAYAFEKAPSGIYRVL